MLAKTLTKKQPNTSKQAKATAVELPVITQAAISNEGLPEGWRWVKLGDVCETTSGGTPSRREPKYYDGNIPWVKSGELDRGLIIDTEEKISEDAIKNSSAKIFPKGTLLIALYGATIGKLAFLGVDAATNQAVCGIFKNDNIDSKYLYHFLFFSKQDLVNQGIGGAQPNISQGILKSLEFPLPPISTQHAIVSKIEELLSELDKGKQQLETAQQQLKIYRQAVLKSAFEGKLTESYRSSIQNETMGACLPAGRFEGKLTNENVKEGELPEDWTLKPLNELGTWRGGGTPTKSRRDFWEKGNIMWVSPKDMKSQVIHETIDKITLNAIENSSTKLIPKGSVLFVVRSGILRRTLPIALTVSEVTVNQDLQAFTPKDLIPEYVYWYVAARNDDIRKNCSKDGTTVESIESAALKNYLIPVCSLKEQHLIVQEIESRLSVCDKVEETISTSLAQAETLRQSILKKAFEGKLIN